EEAARRNIAAFHALAIRPAPPIATSVMHDQRAVRRGERPGRGAEAVRFQHCPLRSFSMNKTIAVIRGDGIGPEIMDATLRVLEALQLGLQYEFVEAGLAAHEATGELLPQATLDAIARHRVALKSP